MIYEKDSNKKGHLPLGLKYCKILTEPLSVKKGCEEGTAVPQSQPSNNQNLLSTQYLFKRLNINPDTAKETLAMSGGKKIG